MSYDYQDFSKSDKKILVNLVEVSVQVEINQFLKNQFNSYQKIMETEYEDIRKPYWELNDSFKDFSKHLVRTYDGWSHRRLTSMVVNWWIDGILTEKDISRFSESGRSKLEEMKKQFESYRR